MILRMLLGVLLASNVAAEVVAVEVHAGDRDRTGALCELALPAFKGRTLALRMKDGTRHDAV